MLPNRTENFGAQIGVADIHQAPRPKLEPLESFPVRRERGIVIYSGGQVAEVRGRQFLTRRLEVHHVQRVLEVGDRPTGRRRLPPGNRPRSQKWAPQQKLQKSATVSRLITRILCWGREHGRPFYRTSDAVRRPLRGGSVPQCYNSPLVLLD